MRVSRLLALSCRVRGERFHQIITKLCVPLSAAVKILYFRFSCRAHFIYQIIQDLLPKPAANSAVARYPAGEPCQSTHARFVEVAMRSQ
ncbi:MAG: hypothetical protein JWN34_1238 [Bryobacterales bacterium]|jgi:hypothetical protein|nr:hypothetical protein [Bryobacterales bacterium]